jgi:hypothetical protein
MADNTDAGVIDEPAITVDYPSVTSPERVKAMAREALAIQSLDDEMLAITKKVLTLKIIAQSYCRAWATSPQCICKGDDANCHASTIYDKEARACFLALEKNRLLK